MSMFLIYLWTRVDAFKDVLDGIIFITLSLSAILSIIFATNEDFESVKKYVFCLIACGFITIGVNVITPTKNDIAIMYVVPKIANSEVVSKDCPELAKLGIEVLKKQMNSMLENKNE